jgi:hypothetical protein
MRLSLAWPSPSRSQPVRSAEPSPRVDTPSLTVMVAVQAPPMVAPMQLV